MNKSSSKKKFNKGSSSHGGHKKKSERNNRRQRYENREFNDDESEALQKLNLKGKMYSIKYHNY